MKTINTALKRRVGENKEEIDKKIRLKRRKQESGTLERKKKQKCKKVEIKESIEEKEEIRKEEGIEEE
jgi:hypothetical protein